MAAPSCEELTAPPAFLSLRLPATIVIDRHVALDKLAKKHGDKAVLKLTHQLLQRANHDKNAEVPLPRSRNGASYSGISVVTVTGSDWHPK